MAARQRSTKGQSRADLEAFDKLMKRRGGKPPHTMKCRRKAKYRRSFLVELNPA